MTLQKTHTYGVNMTEKGLLVILSGFSGAGKGTLVRELLRRYPEEYALSVSATTRQPRAGETDGTDYFFVTKERFEELISSDGLIEYASYVGNYYGTPREYVERQRTLGKDVLLEIEIQGAGSAGRRRRAAACRIMTISSSTMILTKQQKGFMT